MLTQMDNVNHMTSEAAAAADQVAVEHLKDAIAEGCEYVLFTIRDNGETVVTDGSASIDTLALVYASLANTGREMLSAIVASQKEVIDLTPGEAA